MATLAYIAGIYTFLLFGWMSGRATCSASASSPRSGSSSMTWICYIGIELSARTQYFLLTIEIFTLALFAVVALVKVYAGDAGRSRSTPSSTGSTPSDVPGDQRARSTACCWACSSTGAGTQASA